VGLRLDSASITEAAFYTAFERGDPDEMMAVWANSPDIVCVHPLGTVLQGYDAVRASWVELLSPQLPRKFDIEHVQTITAPELVLHVVYESISMPQHRGRFAPIAAINGYRLINGLWLMVLHQAGPVSSTEAEVQPRSQTRH
jgi:ketosteroid isomerase-like protein